MKNQKIHDDQGKAKDTKSYSTYTTYSSEDGDEVKDDKNEKNSESDNKPIHIVRYENTSPIKDNQHSTKQNIVVKHDSEDNEDNDESEEDDGDDDYRHVNEDVELHQPAKPRPTKPVELVKEHRTEYKIENVHPESISTKPQVIIQPSKPIVVVQEHHAGYKVEESDGGKGSDDSGKGHAGSVTKHLYEIYVTHDTGKSNGGGGGGDSKDSDDDGGDGDSGKGNGKSENLVLEHQPEKQNAKTDDTDNGSYKVNINYGKKKGLKKNSGKIYRKRKGNLKRKKIIKPHKYEVEEYTDNGAGTKQPTVATKKASSSQEHSQPIVSGKESSPKHHRDSEDYSNGQQFEFASEADSDAYYW